MTAEPTLEDAVGRHQAGRLDEAHALYGRILAREPRNADALHLSGVVALQQDRAADAVDLIGRALAIVPNDPHYLSNFATALLETGAVDPAIDGFRKALAIEPGHLDARYNLGNALRVRGDLAAAAAEYERVAEQAPAHLAAVNNRALCIAGLGRLNEAVGILEQALDRAPGDARTHNNLGLLLLRLRRADDAVTHFDAASAAAPGDPNIANGRSAALIEAGRLDEAQALIDAISAQVPDHPDTLLNLANLLARKEQPQEAEDVYRRVLRNDAENADGWHNLGILLYRRYRYADADEAIRRALALRPDDPGMLHSYAGSLVAAGRLDEAQAVFDRTVRLAPDMTEVAFDRGLLALATGRFADGFRDYRARGAVRSKTGRLFRDRLAADLSGRTVCVEGDQGLGDEIFFLRFMPQLTSRGAQTRYRGDARLVAMLRRAGVADQVMPADGGAQPDGALTLAAGDLPYALGMTDADAPPPSINLRPEPGQVAALSQRLTALGPPPYVGVTWRAGTQGARDLLSKQVPLDSVARALKGMPGTFVALQRLPRDGELARFAAALGAPLHDLTALNDDLEAMLALVGLLDDYVCVSNTNVHLRAAQNKACRVLVPHPPEFRWMVGRAASPWFPDMRLYRQQPDGDWRPALASLAADVAGGG